MEACLTPHESNALCSLLAETTTDIIVKTDRKGFVLHASGGGGAIVPGARSALHGHHLVDFVDPSFANMVLSEHDAVIHGRPRRHRLEVCAASPECGPAMQWFDMAMRELVDGDGRAYGAVTLMRSIAERRALEEQLFATAMTDPLTGLTNRRAFMAMLGHMVGEGQGGCLSLFAIDHFKAINMRHGPSAGDEVLAIFADLLRTLMREHDIISRIGSETLAVLLPDTGKDQAEAVCLPVIETLAEIGRDMRDFPLTASAGLAAIQGSVDATLKRAELALFMAKVKGQNRLEARVGQG